MSGYENGLREITGTESALTGRMIDVRIDTLNSELNECFACCETLTWNEGTQLWEAGDEAGPCEGGIHGQHFPEHTSADDRAHAQAELTALRELAGVTGLDGDLIHEDALPAYIRSLEESMGDLGRLAGYIDWERYTEDERSNYSEIDVTFGTGSNAREVSYYYPG